MISSSIEKPLPTPTPTSRRFWEAACEKVLAIQRCSNCDRHIFYPRNRCPHCWSDRLDWVTASGDARLATFSVIHKPGHPAFAEETPYVVALVDLVEGPRMLTNLRVPIDLIQIGMLLIVSWEERGDFTLPVFRMKDETDGGSPA
ncbi:Zn-ribbon domain-containing OB-fold protein [Stutzerimonas xanthomarina]|uniref:Zn-ribbon domain-containing OB-fold protein n=1 Tax=Stutzerimonas xanthomarina TaxID=271420 RepID=UPI003AA9A448